MGARLLRSWLLAPLVDAVAINARLDAVDVLVVDGRGRDRLREALDGVRDVERLAGRAALGRATPRDLGALRDSILRLPDVRAALDGLEARGRAAPLEEVADRFDLLQDVGDELARARVDPPPLQAPDGDAIRGGYDRELDDLKDARDGGKQYIAGLQARERERTGIASLKIGFNKVFGYYLEVTNTHRDRVPADYERRQTLTGAERFVTPELKAYEAKVLGAEERIAVREGELVDALRARVRDAIARVQATFMVEMSETSAILHGATARSLVLLDEIGRGTSTYDGVAIAWAVTEFLHNTIGCKTIFATHYHELTQLTEELAHARNFNVAVREAGDEIVFLHRLEPGGTDRSYGIHVGQLAGLPAPVVARAWQVLQLLEAGHHVAHQPAPPPPDAAQLGLFIAPGTGAAPHPLLDELDRLDVNTLSPLEALNRLAAWKKQREERA